MANNVTHKCELIISSKKLKNTYLDKDCLPEPPTPISSM